MSKHTPGPWVVGRCTWNEDRNVCYELNGIKQGCAADARLIAAAPDMLEALQNLENDDGSSMPSSAWKLVQDAIAKATGGAS